MKVFLVIILVISQLLVLTGCDKTKTIKQLENIATELRIHNKNIATVANDFHEKDKLSNTFHKGILTACYAFSKTLDGADEAILVAKKVTTGPELKSALDYAQRFIDVEVFGSFVKIGGAVFNVPPEVKAKIEITLSAIRALFATLRTILAQANPLPALKTEVYSNV